MKISNHLPQFKQAHLIISAGKQEATYFLANGNDVKQIHSTHVETPHLSDHEGMYASVGGGRSSGAGAVRESKDMQMKKEFMKQFAADTGKLVNEHKIEKIYLFCPTYLSNQAEDSLPNELQSKIEYIFYGNYLSQHPFVLLSKIQEHLRSESEDGKVTPVKSEAMKILHKTDPAMGL